MAEIGSSATAELANQLTSQRDWIDVTANGVFNLAGRRFTIT